MKWVCYYNGAVRKQLKMCGCGGTGRRAGLKIQLW